MYIIHGEPGHIKFSTWTRDTLKTNERVVFFIRYFYILNLLSKLKKNINR